jgi:hypothetical protein
MPPCRHQRNEGEVIAMTKINTIKVNIETGDLSGAGTDGDVYVGVAGREFFLDTTRDDFERGSSRQYVLGSGSNVNNAGVNDPRKQNLLVEAVDFFPVYIRFQPESRGDNWQLQRAVLTLNEDFFPQWDSAGIVFADPAQGIVLGVRAGLVVHLPRHAD